MKDKNGVEVKVGSLIKRCGYVQYADGKRYKVSKKTWKISNIKDGELFYEQPIIDVLGNHITQEIKLNRPKDEGDFIVVGDEKGFFEEYKPVSNVVTVNPGSVEQTYRIHKDVKEKNWKKGDIVKIHGNVAPQTLDEGTLEKVPDGTPHQHVLVVVDPVQVPQGINNPQ